MTAIDKWDDERRKRRREKNLRERGVPWSAADDWVADNLLTILLVVGGICIASMIIAGIVAT